MTDPSSAALPWGSQPSSSAAAGGGALLAPDSDLPASRGLELGGRIQVRETAMRPAWGRPTALRQRSRVAALTAAARPLSP